MNELIFHLFHYNDYTFWKKFLVSNVSKSFKSVLLESVLFGTNFCGSGTPIFGVPFFVLPRPDWLYISFGV